MKLTRVCGHTVFLDQINAQSIIVDCGVNRGEFSKWFIDNKSCETLGFEPDPRRAESLFKIKGLKLIRKAVAPETGTIDLYLNENSDASIKFAGSQVSTQVESVSLRDFIEEYKINKIDLLKIDIEGAELEVLEALDCGDLRRISQITIEFHDFLDCAQIPEVKRVLRKLEKSGFRCFRFSFYDYSDVVVLNTQFWRFSYYQISMIYFQKMLQNLIRLVSRISNK